MATFARLIALLITILHVACSAADGDGSAAKARPEEHPDAYVIRLEAAGERGFRATLPDGTAYDDSDAYAADFAAIERAAAAHGAPIVFALGEREATELEAIAYDAPDGELATLAQALTASGTYTLPLGYVFAYYADEGAHVGGCVSAPAYPGAGVSMYRDGIMLWHLQLGRYRQNGATCLGVYEQRTGYTRCGCAPRFPELPAEIRDALIRKGVSAATAWIVAKAITPVVNGLMPL